MPFKTNQDRRHHIPVQRHRVTNWPVYEAGLRDRGSLTVWSCIPRMKHRLVARSRRVLHKIQPLILHQVERPWRTRRVNRLTVP
jgi:hypothetical protein